jgi:hypothetical protein
VPKAWLAEFPWEGVVALNAQLCAAKQALHKPTSDGYDDARLLWEKLHAREMGLDEAVELCGKCHRIAPFCFFNGNTFAAIARTCIVSASGLSSTDQYLLKNIVGHIVAGTATLEEEAQFQDLLRKLP